jgi:tRNA (cytidine/uridine-2'-O-)-methyltransferase
MEVVLVEPEIPPNTGNIARLCAATGSTLHLVGPLGFRLDDRSLIRAGMDFWQHVKWRRWESLEELRAAAGSEGRFWYLSAKAARSYTEVRYRPGDHLVFGKESAGLPRALLESHPEETISIPMVEPRVRCLNLATAAGIVLYEALRQVKAV